jgi:hypothetical protein
MGKLQDEFNHPVPVVHDATVAAMTDLDLKLSEDRADKLSAHMESEFSDGAHVWINLDSVSDSRCRLTIRVGLAGDEVRSRKIYEAIKQNLPPSQSRVLNERLDGKSMWWSGVFSAEHFSPRPEWPLVCHEGLLCAFHLKEFFTASKVGRSSA